MQKSRIIFLRYIAVLLLCSTLSSKSSACLIDEIAALNIKPKSLTKFEILSLLKSELEEIGITSRHFTVFNPKFIKLVNSYLQWERISGKHVLTALHEILSIFRTVYRHDFSLLNLRDSLILAHPELKFADTLPKKDLIPFTLEDAGLKFAQMEDPYLVNFHAQFKSVGGTLHLVDEDLAFRTWGAAILNLSIEIPDHPVIPVSDLILHINKHIDKHAGISLTRFQKPNSIYIPNFKYSYGLRSWLAYHMAFVIQDNLWDLDLIYIDFYKHILPRLLFATSAKIDILKNASDEKKMDFLLFIEKRLFLNTTHHVAYHQAFIEEIEARNFSSSIQLVLFEYIKYVQYTYAYILKQMVSIEIEEKFKIMRSYRDVHRIIKGRKDLDIRAIPFFDVDQALTLIYKLDKNQRPHD